MHQQRNSFSSEKVTEQSFDRNDVHRSGSNGSSIFVANIPVDITMVEIREVFKPYGEVLYFEKKKNRTPHQKLTFGFLTLSSASGAQRAIKELSNVEPYFLKCEMYRSYASKSHPKMNKSFDDTRNSIKAADHRNECSMHNQLYDVMPPLLPAKDSGVCKTCGEVATMYCFRCCVWQCCKTCNLPCKTTEKESTSENSCNRVSQMLKNLLVKGESNGRNLEAPTPSCDEMIEVETLPFFEYVPVVVVQTLGQYEYWVIVKENYEVVCKLSDVLNNSKLFTFVPVLNAYCVARYQGDWYRAKISHVENKIIVKYIDFGNSEAVSLDDIRTLPRELKKPNAQAIKIKLLPGTPSEFESLPSESLLHIACVEKSDDMSLVVVENVHYEDVAAQTTSNSLMNSVPKENGQDLKYIELQKGHCVISHAVSLSELYIRSVNPDSDSMLKKVLHGVASHCISARAITSLPRPGCILAARYSNDGQFYRAVVLEVPNDRQILVQFLDFGNQDKVPLSDLTDIPKHIVNVPCLAVPTRLRGVTKNVNKCVKALLDNYITYEEVLLLKSYCSKSSEVDLYTLDNEYVNTKINKMLNESDNDIFKIEDVPVRILECNEMLELIVHSLNMDELEICGSFFESEVVLQQIQEEINDFCDKARPYKPQTKEVCWGKYEDRWVRCVLCNEDGLVSIVDTGENAVLQSFRKLTEKYVKLEAGGLKCKLRDCARSGKNKGVVSMLLRPGTVIEAFLVHQDKSGLSWIEVPKIRKYLDQFS